MRVAGTGASGWLLLGSEGRHTYLVNDAVLAAAAAWMHTKSSSDQLRDAGQAGAVQSTKSTWASSYRINDRVARRGRTNGATAPQSSGIGAPADQSLCHGSDCWRCWRVLGKLGGHASSACFWAFCFRVHDAVDF